MLRHLALRVVRSPAQPRRYLATADRLCARYSSLINDAFLNNKPEKIIEPGSQRLASCGPPPCLRDELLCSVSDPIRDSCSKVTIVGAGTVGVACTTSLLCQKITGHIAIVDAFPKRMEAEAMDFQHGSVFVDDPRVEFDTDFCASSNSKVVVLTAGARRSEDESRLDLLQRNVEIFKTIIPPLVQYSPEAVFVVATNPVPLWSGVNVAGVQLRDIVPNIGLTTDYEKWNEVFQDVVRAATTVRCLKGYTSTAIGFCVADLVDSILRNVNDVKSISTLVQGHHDISEEIFFSLPAALGEGGISKIVRMRMTEYEKKLLMISAEAIAKAQKCVKI